MLLFAHHPTAEEGIQLPFHYGIAGEAVLLELASPIHRVCLSFRNALPMLLQNF